MKILQTIQMKYAMVGMAPSNQSDQNVPLSNRVLQGFSLIGCSIVLQVVYSFRVANGFMEYMECACSVSAGIIMFVSLAAIAFQRSTLAANHVTVQTYIDTSEMSPNLISLRV